MAPESLDKPTGQPRIYNEKTDMWSYGVTIWEIFALGERNALGWTLLVSDQGSWLQKIPVSWVILGYILGLDKIKFMSSHWWLKNRTTKNASSFAGS